MSRPRWKRPSDDPVLPGRFAWTKGSERKCYFQVIKTTKRDREGRTLYRCKYLAYGVLDRQCLWLAKDLIAAVRARGRWLSREPSRKVLDPTK